MTTAPLTAAAHADYLAAVGKLAEKVADLDLLDALDGYRWVQTLSEVAVDAYVRSDPLRPCFVPVIGPGRQWGGDSADAHYCIARIDPGHTYRVRGTIGDSAYLSLTCYGGGAAGEYLQQRVVGIVNHRDLTVDADGHFEIALSMGQCDGDAIQLAPDACFLMTRDYLDDIGTGRPTQWHIECIDAADAVFKQDDAGVAARWRAATTFLEAQAAFQPVPYAAGNTLDDPSPPPREGLGWAAIDAAYAGGTYDLSDDDALVIDGRSPGCACWSLCLWNPLLHTFDFHYDQVTINGGAVRYNDDGSWRLVVAARDPGHPNWLCTQGRRRGRLWFRWFLPEVTPVKPTLRVVPVGDVAGLAAVV